MLQRRSVFMVLVALAGLLTPPSLTAQHVVEGRVLNADDGLPIADVTVRVIGEDLELGTDSAGEFSFELPDDRPGVALRVEVIGFAPISRTWMLPLERPIVLALEREAVELEGIDVDVDRPTGWAARPLEYQLQYRVRSMMGIERTATAADLRSFPHQEAEVWDFLPQMTVATGAGCPECIMASGRIPDPTFVIDDRGVSFDEFRSYAVEEICRVDVVTLPRAGSSSEGGVVIAYTCQFLRDVATGKRTLSFVPGGNGG
jgi:hypothetical protein